MKKPVNKICKDCKWFVPAVYYDMDCSTSVACSNPNLPVDVVYGKPTTSHPEDIRTKKKLCGPTGKWHAVVEKVKRKKSWPWYLFKD